jgi:hypothetical protein
MVFKFNSWEFDLDHVREAVKTPVERTLPKADARRFLEQGDLPFELVKLRRLPVNVCLKLAPPVQNAVASLRSSNAGALHAISRFNGPYRSQPI